MELMGWARLCGFAASGLRFRWHPPLSCYILHASAQTCYVSALLARFVPSVLPQPHPLHLFAMSTPAGHAASSDFAAISAIYGPEHIENIKRHVLPLPSTPQEQAYDRLYQLKTLIDAVKNHRFEPLVPPTPAEAQAQNARRPRPIKFPKKNAAAKKKAASKPFWDKFYKKVVWKHFHDIQLHLLTEAHQAQLDYITATFPGSSSPTIPTPSLDDCNLTASLSAMADTAMAQCDLPSLY